ncbi:MAG: phospholipid carrier-dependent glycosyltransferase [Acidobacteria bacterium]|nr:MAG: phospholipid carrier-dependent glycosyltransferase [Acidobacteriota bacterium]
MAFLEAAGIDALIITILTLLVALRAGRAVFTRLTHHESCDAWEMLFFSIGLGLGLMSLATFFLGALGLLYRPVFQGLFIVSLAVSAPGLVRDFRSLPPKPIPRVASWLSYAVIAFLAGIVVVCLLAALAPETGFDALNYHLGTPRLYIANHGIVETENLAGYSHPLAVDMLYAFAWLVHSSLAAKLIHFAFGLLTAAGCWIFCRRYAAPGAGSLAALLFLSSPIVMYLSQTAYADLGLAFFALLAVLAAFRWLESGLAHWILLAGIYSGLSVGAKYMGGAVVAVILVIGLVALARAGQRRRVLWNLVLYCAVSLLVFAPWAVKNWILTGNPIAPALSHIIPTEGFYSPDYDRLVQLTRTWHGHSGTVLDWILTPWRQAIRTDIFHGSPGLAYLILFPIAVILSWRDRWLRLITLCVAVGYTTLLLGTATTRFFVLVFPWISILIAGALCPRLKKQKAWSRQVLVLSSLVLVTVKLPWFSPLFGIPEPLILDTAKLKVFRTAGERDEFLETRALGPGGNQFYEYLDGLPEGTRILALTPVYQALTDHPVFMPPNSTPSSQMASAAIDWAKSEMGLKDVELNLTLPDLTGRFWKLQVNSAAALTADETHPRLFYVENSIPMELAVYGVTLRSTGEGVREVVVDLAAPSRVERVTLLSRAPAPTATYRVFGSPGRSETEWQQMPATSTIHQPDERSRERLRGLLAQNRITHVVLGHHAGAQFLPEFFVKGRGFPKLKPVKSFGNYEVLAVEP